MTKFQSLINKSIKTLRTRSNLSQEKFCSKCNISTDNYRNLEYNKQMPKSSTIDKICSSFNISPIELLKLGIDKADESMVDIILTKLDGLNKRELELISDFISLLKLHNH